MHDMTRLTIRLGATLGCSLLAVVAAAQSTPPARPTLPGGRPAPVTPSVQPSQPAKAANFTIDPKVAAKLESLEIIPPPNAAAPRVPGSVIIGRRTLAEELPKFGVKRTFSADQMRTATNVRLGEAKVDFKPLLTNDKLALNIAGNLRKMTDLADVRGEQTRAYQGDRGLIVQSIVRYELKPGACSTPASRGRLAQAGVACAMPTTDAQIEAEMANPKSPRFVDGSARAGVIAKMRQQRAAERGKVMGHVKTMRTQMAATGQRGAMIAKLGAGELSRLEGLTDEQLANELANSGVTTVEQTMFIPAYDEIDAATAASGTYTPLKMSLQTPVLAYLPKQAATPDAFKPTSTPLKREVFLTGFTEGRTYRWNERIEKSINWCWVGCTETYFAEAWLGFNYGLGMRFPMEVTGTYNYEGKDKASVKLNLKPINGAPADYLASGLPADKVFGGKEFVAEIGFDAGIKAKLPTFPTLGTPPINKTLDLTTYMPSPVTGGQFLPPSPGNPTVGTPYVIRDIDFLFGYGNLGIVGAKIHPAVQLSLYSNKLSFEFEDKLANQGIKPVSSGETIPLMVGKDNQASAFRLGEPVYDFSFGITPGVTANLFLDLAVWSTSFDHTIMLPQLEVKFPPGGLQFGCHFGTVCNRSYSASPKGVFVGEEPGPNYDPATPEGQIGLALQGWRKTYDSKWVPQCKDDTCRFAIKLMSFGTALGTAKKMGANTGGITPTLNMLNAAGSETETYAAKHVKQSFDRTIAATVDSFYQFVQAVWTKKCFDALCADGVKKQTDAMAVAVAGNLKQDPDKSRFEVQTAIGKIYVPKLQAEIDASKARTGGVKPSV